MSLPLSALAVRSQLERICTAPDFASAPQLVVFLRYVVERTIAGEQDRIKAYSIATEALGRPAQFDPQEDAIVRVQARRLRQALALYYSGPGQEDGIVIEMPTGSYVPEIRSRGVAAAVPASQDQPSPARRQSIPAAAVLAALVIALAAAALSWWWWRPQAAVASAIALPSITVMVANERDMPPWFRPALFRSALEDGLARFDDIEVISPEVSVSGPRPSYRAELAFTATTTLVQGTVRLSREKDGKIIWTDRFSIPVDSIGNYGDLFALRRLVSKLAQPYGVIYADALSGVGRGSDLACLFSGYEYFSRQTLDAFNRAETCLRGLARRMPDLHLARIQLSYLFLEAYRDGQIMSAADPLEQALELAREAVRINPESARSHQAMMASLAVKGEHESAIAAGRIAISLNPNDSKVLGDFGCRLVTSGKYSEGEVYVSRAMALLAAPPPWQLFCLYVAADHRGDRKAAASIAAKLEDSHGVLANLVVAVEAGNRLNKPRGIRAVERLKADSPLFRRDAAEAMRRRGWSPAVIGRLLQGLTTAGYHPG